MINIITRHELRQVLSNPRSWYTLAVLFALMAILFNWLMNIYLQDQLLDINIATGVTEAVIHPYYAWFALISLILIPSVTTQYLCGEKNRGTLLNYHFTKLTATQLFLGKLNALGIMLALLLCCISCIPLTIMLSGTLDWGQFVTCILGVYLMLWVAIAVGLCISAFMHNILRANFMIFSGLVIFIMFEWAAQFTKYSLFLQKFALLKPLKSFLAGVISPAYIIYYLLVIAACVVIGSWRIAHGNYRD